MTTPNRTEMEAPGFTPGPWRVAGADKNFVEQYVVHNGEELWGPYVADCSMLDEGAANANLISASPDMYEALKETLDVLSSRHQNLTTGHWEDGELQLLGQKIEAALLKAKGGKDV